MPKSPVRQCPLRAGRALHSISSNPSRHARATAWDARVRAELTHGALHVHSYRFPRQTKNGREFVGRFSCSNPAKALAFSTTQGRLLGRLEELGETLSNGFMVDVRKEQKRRDIGLGAPNPRAIIRFADHRNEAKMAWGVGGHRKASYQAEVGEIVPRPSLLLCQAASRPYRRPIKAHTSIKAGVIVGAVGVEEVPTTVPSTGKIEGPVLVHTPLAGRVLCGASNIPRDKTIDPNLAQGIGQDAYGTVDAFRRQDFFPKLMPRTHDGHSKVPSPEAPFQKFIQHRVSARMQPPRCRRRNGYVSISGFRRRAHGSQTGSADDLEVGER